MDSPRGAERKSSGDAGSWCTSFFPPHARLVGSVGWGWDTGDLRHGPALIRAVARCPSHARTYKRRTPYKTMAHAFKLRDQAPWTCINTV